jgi:Tfp pilus assembly protein PilN
VEHVISEQAATMRARLEAIDAEIASEAAAVLAAGLEGELAAVRVAADELNRALARALGLRVFALSHRGNRAFIHLMEHISGLQTPEIGATRAETEAAAAEWERRFEELAR